ncbi:hypothetical protein ACLMJK_007892 [Lecanora helva]
MPIGMQRLNAQRPQPSSQIVFIKPLPGPDEKYAQDFLERIAAICHPIMKQNHLSIMALEEHEPNPEFIGRNFNAGEIIQLVLKAPYTGHWLSFRSVQMVMMHELAHCVQMNHSGAFWKVNNQYKNELRGLWSKGYTGDGLWGKGQTLLSGQYHAGATLDNEVLPAHLCGGTFRTSRRGKRKRGADKPKETYAERQQRRIRKKFGLNGQSLGNNEDARVQLENGKKPKGKPRVAGSARGRELRAAAALARFDQIKEEATKKEEEEEEESLFGYSDTESESDLEAGDEAIDINGSQMRDRKGRGMIKVCGDEDRDDSNVKNEIEELQGLNSFDSSLSEGRSHFQPSAPSVPQSRVNTHLAPTSVTSDSSRINLYDIPQYVEPKEDSDPPKSQTERHQDRSTVYSHSCNAFQSNQVTPNIRIRKLCDSAQSARSVDQRSSSDQEPASDIETKNDVHSRTTDIVCPICSMANEPYSFLCIACSHVLDTGKVTRYWYCQSDPCRGSEYINSADCGLCGVCGARKPGETP